VKNEEVRRMDICEIIKKAVEAAEKAETFDEVEDKFMETFDTYDVEFYWFFNSCIYIVHKGFYKWHFDTQKLTTYKSEEEFLKSLEFINPEAVKVYKDLKR